MHNHLVLANGNTIDWPIRQESGAGWILKPDEARTNEEIRRGTGRSFGRGSEGRSIRDEWTRQHLQLQFDSNNWIEPVSHDFPKWNDNPTGNGLTVAIKTEPFGWNHLKFKVEEPRRWGTPVWNVQITWEGAAIQEWYRLKQVPEYGVHDPLRLEALHDKVVQFETRSDGIYELAEAFAQDPIGFCEKHLEVELPWTAQDLPTIDWGPRVAHEAYMDTLETVWISVDAEHVFYKDGEEAKRVFYNATKEMELLQAALSHLDLDFRVITGYDYGHNTDYHHVLKGFVAKLPADDHDMHNRRGHTITVGPDKVEIECGYVEDDKKWEEWKARQAADWLNAFEKETLSTEETIEEYEYKPNQ